MMAKPFDWLDVPAPRPYHDCEYTMGEFPCMITICPDCEVGFTDYRGRIEVDRAYHRHHYLCHQLIDPSEVR